MSIHLAFESTVVNETSSRETVKVSYYSNESKRELEDFIDFNFPPGKNSSRGSVENVTYRQDGPFWYADVSCYTNYGGTLLVSWGSSRPLNHSLRSIRLSLPLERKSGYLTKWDHYLWAQLPVDIATDPSLPALYDTASTEKPFYDGLYWQWTKAGSDLDGTPKNGFFWKCLATPTKPGVTCYDCHTYQITEYGEYPNETQAAWITSVLLDRIRTTPLLGDFGLAAALPGSGWNWKCDDATVNHNGKKWEAQMVWTLSGDANGWDTDLYDPSSNSSS